MTYDVATLTEASRRAVLKLFVRRELLDVETVQSMLAWPHSGVHVHDAVRVAADDCQFAVRLARYRARNPEPVIRGDAVWAVSRDELDVARIVRFRVVRP